MQTQNKRLLAYLAEHKYITALEAINELGIYRLASRICDLRRIGYEISSEMITVKNRFEEDCRVKRYWIVGKAVKLMRDRLVKAIKDSLIKHIDKSCLLAENIADDLLANGVIVPPCKVGDTVYCIIAKGGLCGGLIYTGHIVARKVDKLIYDGSRWEMMSDRVYPDYKDGNGLIYAYFDDLAFVSEEKAKARLNEILEVGYKHKAALKGGEGK